MTLTLVDPFEHFACRLGPGHGAQEALWSSRSLDIVGQGVRFGKYQDWKVCPEQPLLGTLLL